MSAASEAKIIKGNLLLILLKTKLMKSERYKKFKMWKDTKILYPRVETVIKVSVKQ